MFALAYMAAACVVGENNFLYDLLGGVALEGIVFIPRGEIDSKGKGLMRAFFGKSMTDEQVKAKLISVMDSVSHGNYDQAEKSAQECLAAIAKDPEDSRHINIYEMLGNIAWHRTDYSTAIELYKKVLSGSIALDYQLGIANGNSKLGMAYSGVADYTKALEHLQSALQFYSETNNLAALAGATCNLATVYARLDDKKTSLEYFEQALALATEANHDIFKSIITGNIGATYVQLGNYTIGIEYFLKSLSIHIELGNKHSISNTCKNLGAVYCDYLKEYDTALEYMSKALSIAEELGATGLIAGAKFNIGCVLMNDDFDGFDPVLAEKNILESIELFKEIGANHDLIKAHSEISKLYKRQSSFENALHHLELTRELEKIVVNSDVKKHAEQLDYERKNAEREKQIAVERTRFQERESVLNNILPEEITIRLIKGENPIADIFDSVSTLFMDIVNFTTLSTKISAQQLVHLLNAIFSAADGVMREFGLEKIKTIGDAYMAVAGAPIPQEDHAHRAANAALKLLDVIKNLEVTFPGDIGDRSWLEIIPEIEVRIGLHCGPVAAGVVGENKFLYDLWGDAVNTASRMESHGEAGKIHVSEDFVNALSLKGSSDTFWYWEKEGMRAISRGEIEIKGKGIMRTFFLERG